jgi:1-acyl-sn-glycerol-3-phosphate acyltransferase
MDRIIGSLRVGWRLVLLATLTGVTTWRLGRRRDAHAPAGERELEIGRRWARRSARLLGVRIDVRGTPPAGRVLLLANHRSYLDIVALLAQVPCAFLAKSEVGEWPLFGAAARHQGTVFVQRKDKASRRAARAGAAAVLTRGLPFAAFPEGTTFRGPGALPFFPGLFDVAAEQGVPVVPVAIEYGDPADAWVDDESFLGHFVSCFRKPSVRVHVHFGPALREDCPRTLHARAESWVHGALARALPHVRGAEARPASASAAAVPA